MNRIVNTQPITIYTIGFAGKTAKEFFDKLKDVGIKRLIDIRLNNISQLAGFTKKKDLEYFLRVIVNADYAHFEDLAPTKDILDSFKKQKEMTWSDYEQQFNRLMDQRSPETHHLPSEFDKACLLCSEATPDKCHRRLVAEHLRRKWGNVEIKHL